ncbi:MAG: porin family protein [Roseivirga sp.]|nr:porin family protein [Roseivirga sp.]
MKNLKDKIVAFISLFLIMLCTDQVYAQDSVPEEHYRKFDGLYFGAGIGTQNIFGGAFINELDVLAQKQGFVLELSTGYRRQFLNDQLLVGLEFQYGITDGDLKAFDDRFDLDIFYSNNSQSGYGLTLGITPGVRKKYLIYTYAKITERSFEIEFTETNGTDHFQSDGQRFLQYGLGLELHLTKKLNLRTSFGRVDVDFGDMMTSQDVEDQFDINLGLVFQF